MPHCVREATHHGHHIFAFDKAHFQVNLTEFCLTVGARILVAQALADLDVAIESSHHQDLLEELRALWQGVPHALVESRWDDKVARAFRRALDEKRGLYFSKSVGREVVARQLRDLAARAQDVLHAWAAQVDVSVLEADFLVDLLGIVIIGQDGRVLCLVEDLKFFGSEFHLASGEFVIWLTGTETKNAAHADHVFAAERLGLLHEFGAGMFEIEDHLAEAVSIPNVHEQESATLVAIGVHPSVEGDCLTGIGKAWLSAGVRALEHGGGVQGEGSRIVLRRAARRPLAYRGSRAHCGCSHSQHTCMRNLEPAPLAALAGEDRAALSGRPRKAIASQ